MWFREALASHGEAAPSSPSFPSVFAHPDEILSKSMHSLSRLTRRDGVLPALEAESSDSTDFLSGVVVDRGMPLSRRVFLNDTTAPDYTHGLTGVNLTMDQRVVGYLWISIVSILLAVLFLRLWQLCNAHIRHIYCLTGSQSRQNYWAYDKSSWWPWLKRQVIYAPLGSKRHNREIQLSKATNYGTLPGRIHAGLLALYVVSNIVYTTILPYGRVEKAHLIAELRGRSGMLAVVNMIPLVILAARNNPIIGLLKISFDTFNLFHRWLGRLIIVLSCVHIMAWYLNMADLKGADAAAESLSSGAFIQWGVVAGLSLCIILVQSLSPVRHAFYETFLHLHQFLALAVLIGVFVHLEVATLPALPFIRAVVGLWGAERTMRVLRLLSLNFSFHTRLCTNVTVEALPAEACRVTFNLPTHVTVRPGSHAYIYIPAISWWQSHPFSIAWTDVGSEPPTGPPTSDRFCSQVDLEERGLKTVVMSGKRPTSISFIIAARSGMTRRLYDRAKASLPGAYVAAGLVEGPYAGHDSLSSYGTVVMFAGGAGITHHLVQIRHLIAGAQACTFATRKIVLVWTVRDLDALIWIRPWMDEILRMPGRRDVLSLALYVTRARNGSDYASPHSTIKLIPKRCDPGAVLDEVLPTRVGASMVTVCGPGAFADEVRAAVRRRLNCGCIDLNEESFTW